MGRRSSDPIFIKNNGSIIFYEDKQSRSGEDLICWTYGNNGNTFIYFTSKSEIPFCSFGLVSSTSVETYETNDFLHTFFFLKEIMFTMLSNLVMEFLPRYVGFKNTIQMKVRYEWNCVTVAGLGKPTDLEKTGLLTMKFADCKFPWPMQSFQTAGQTTKPLSRASLIRVSKILRVKDGT